MRYVFSGFSIRGSSTSSRDYASDLSTPQKTSIENMLITEADRFIGYTVPSFRSRSGAVVTVGD